MSKGAPNNRQKDIARLLRDQGNKKGTGFKVLALRPTKILGPSGKGR